MQPGDPLFNVSIIELLGHSAPADIVILCKAAVTTKLIRVS